MPWGIIAIPAIACLIYGFLLGLKSVEVEVGRLMKKQKPDNEDRD